MNDTKLTHVDARGKARMVDVTGKDMTERAATANGSVVMKKETLGLILSNEVKKGDVLGVARLAGIMAAKKTSELIPLCHPLNITSVEVDFTPSYVPPLVAISATVKVAASTGVEMEALTAVAAAALTIYDMCKAADKGMRITEIRLVRKTGGKSGDYSAE
ncbi:MAG: cyclic pyranopterin monophosphate synthase MoaC [Deltaproteobacteria bacterium]|nr:cyclic pyranopterin monophosphate synthase MoaC [Deltaproteobacteria bacterium]